MAELTRRSPGGPEPLAKCPTGIKGLDEITHGGLPRGRCTLVCGGAGCGKTLLGMEFLVRGAMEFDEPGVFMSFEETAEELTRNVASLGFDLADLESRKKLAMDHVFIERSEIEDTGDYDLEGPVHPPGLRHRLRRRQTGGAGHGGGPVCRAPQRADPARRAAAPVPLAERQGRHRHHHRRAGRRTP